MRLLAWQYERMSRPVPEAAVLRRQAKKLVDDAHRIARERGKNVLGIIRQMAVDFMKKSG